MQEALQSCYGTLPLKFTSPRLPCNISYISPRGSLCSHCHITCVVYGMRMETRISSGLRQVFLYPTKKFESNVTVRLESVVDIVVTIHVYVSEVSCGMYMIIHVPFDAKLSLAPQAISTGFRSDIGLALQILPPIDCGENTIVKKHYIICLARNFSLQYFVSAAQQTTSTSLVERRTPESCSLI